MIRQLLGHTAAYTFANLASRGTVLVWLLVLPSFISSSEYGALGLILTAAALVNVAVPLEISQALARYYPPAAPADQREYLRTAWTFTLAMLAIASFAAFAFAPQACNLLLGSLAYLHVFRVAILFFALNALFYFLQCQFRWQFEARKFVVATVMSAIVTLGGSIGLAALLPDSLLGVLLGQAAGAGVGVAAGIYGLRKGLTLGIDRAKLRQLLRLSLPIVPASLSIFLSIYSSRLILRDLLDLRDVGVFSWASQLASIPALLLLGLQGALTPLVMKHHGEDSTRIVLARTFEAIIAIGLVACLGVGGFTPELIGILGYSEFGRAGDLALILAPGYLFLQVYVFAPGFSIRERTELQLLVSILGAVSAVGFNYLFIDLLGVRGAAVATLLSSAVFIGSWFAVSQWLYPIPVRWLQLFAFIGVAALGGAALSAIGTGTAIAILAKLFVLAFVTAAILLCGLVRLRDWGRSDMSTLVAP